MFFHIKKSGRGLNSAEKDLLEVMVKLKLAESSDNRTLVCSTGGPPLVLRRIIKARKGSSELCSPYRKRKANEDKKYLSKTSGPKEDDSIKQMATVLKTTKAKTARKVLDLSGHGVNAVTAKEMVVLQNKLGFSNRGSRVVSQFLRKKGLKVPTEKEVKDFKEKALSGKRKVEKRTVLKYHGPLLAPTPVEIPVAQIEDLDTFVKEMLDRLHEKV